MGLSMTGLDEIRRIVKTVSRSVALSRASAEILDYQNRAGGIVRAETVIARAEQYESWIRRS